MKTRNGNISDYFIGLALLLLFLILTAISLANQARANLQTEARASGCFASTIEAPVRSDIDE
ncbi:MAG: hypothetical protein WD795_14250 [Woeseia sp.]